MSSEQETDESENPGIRNRRFFLLKATGTLLSGVAGGGLISGIFADLTQVPDARTIENQQRKATLMKTGMTVGALVPTGVIMLHELRKDLGEEEPAATIEATSATIEPKKSKVPSTEVDPYETPLEFRQPPASSSPRSSAHSNPPRDSGDGRRP